MAYMFADDTKVYRNIKTHIDREYEYYMNRDTKIGVTTNERDLGVQIDPDLKLNNQNVEMVTSKANRMLGMIWQAYTYKDGGTIKKLSDKAHIGIWQRRLCVIAQKRTTADRECAEKSYKDGPRTSKPRIHRQTESDEIAEHVLQKS